MLSPFAAPTANTVSAFDCAFEVVPAKTRELLDQVYALRYLVYGVEHQFEDTTRYPDRREADLYDAMSEHVALIYRQTGEVVGTARLVMPKNEMFGRFPMTEFVGQEVQQELKKYPLAEMAEISRYAISKSFRRRAGEEEYADVGWSESKSVSERRLMPYLTLGLMRGILQMSELTKVNFFCACMRPALLKLLSQFGLHFRPVGPTVEYHGRRQPCVASREDLLQGLKVEDARYYNIVNGAPDVAPLALEHSLVLS
jgi:N-acyl amino acid synthase of PEP-CTERM/exosortase system